MTGWRLEGTVLIACSCDWGCPCNVNARPTKGHCEGGWTWVIDSGHHGDVRFDGRAFSIFAKWPGAIHEGNGRAISFIDERTNEAQREMLGRLVRGELGGPWEIFINTYAIEGPEPASYRIDLADHATTLRVGDAVQLEIQPITNPVTGAEIHPELLLPEGLVLNRAALAASKVFRVDDGVSFDHSGQYSAFGRFEYEGTSKGP